MGTPLSYGLLVNCKSSYISHTKTTMNTVLNAKCSLSVLKKHDTQTCFKVKSFVLLLLRVKGCCGSRALNAIKFVMPVKLMPDQHVCTQPRFHAERDFGSTRHTYGTTGSREVQLVSLERGVVYGEYKAKLKFHGTVLREWNKVKSSQFQKTTRPE